jgi:phage terminase Nu1 subunit (DNA packaging protein)
MADQPPVLSSWKDIANHFGKSVRTVQRWELKRGLPVRRPDGHACKSALLLYRNEANAWMAKQYPSPDVNAQASREITRLAETRSVLQESIQIRRQLRQLNRELRQGIFTSVGFLLEQCASIVKRGNAPVSR